MPDYFDLNLLSEKSDSRHTAVHLKVSGLCREDIDFGKVSSLGYSKSTVKGWLSQTHSVPITVLKNPNSLCNRVLFLNSKASKQNVKLPVIDEKLLYFVGVVYGDGHISPTIRKRATTQSYRQCRVVIQKGVSKYSEYYLPSVIEEIFSIKPKLYFRTRISRLISITINSKIVSRIFTNVFHFVHGKKSDAVIDFIRQFPDNLQLAFITGLLDTDGGKSGDSFAFCSSSEKTALYVKDFFEQKLLPTKLYYQQYGKYSWYQVRIPIRGKAKFLETFPLKNERKYAGERIRTADTRLVQNSTA